MARRRSSHLVLTVVELLRQPMKRQALVRFEKGDWCEAQEEPMDSS
ncbi:gas vesicle protein GvpK [Streptomyces sp. NPDC002676]